MRAWVWVTHDHRQMGDAIPKTPFTVLGEKYALAIESCADAQPLTLPTAHVGNIQELLAHVDGVLLTGSPSNVHPSHFSQSILRPDLPLDPQRDDLTLPLVRACLEDEVPLLGICRGFQEINVALGGSLHQQVHSVPGMLNHCESLHLSDSEKYAPVHPLRIVADTELAQWAGGLNARVNSLHQQGIDRLADALDPIAFAPDGLVEAVQVRGAKAFAYAVQWHPEWSCQDDLLQAHIFKAFGDACRHRQVQRLLRQAGQHQAGNV